VGGCVVISAKAQRTRKWALSWQRGRGLLSYHSVLSFPNQDPRMGSICSEMVGLEGKMAIVNTLRCGI
jgi:hypothetical protein